MPIVQLKWTLSNLATLLSSGFDQQKIEVENPPTVWTELTRSHLRLPIVENVENYLWECPSDISYSFRVTPHRSSDSVDDTPIAITDTQVRGYCTIADIRAEGYADPPHTDERIQGAIDRAVATIDRVCGQRFDPYFSKVRLDVKRRYEEQHLDVPIAALWKAVDNAETVELEHLVVYNRHLTENLTNPDDRRAPMIAWTTGDVVFTRPSMPSISGGSFIRGRQTLDLWGVFGFTELGSTDQMGETAEGSQIPLSYGSTPLDIRQACMLLVTGYLPTLASGGDDSSLKSRIKREKTRDQEYDLQSLPAEELTYGMTGNNQVDNILMRYVAPMRIGAV